MTKKELTEQELKDLHYAANKAWQQLGGDFLQAIAEGKGKNAETITLPRSHVVELVIDAGRLEQDMRDDKTMTPTLEKLFKSYDGSLTKIVALGFLHGRYGM